MGSVLVDKKLLWRYPEAVKECRENLDGFEGAYKVMPVRLQNIDEHDLCAGLDPAIVWGTVSMVHWILNPPDWEERLMSGDGYKSSGDTGIYTQAGNYGLIQFAIEASIWHITDTEEITYIYDPYGEFLDELSHAGADVKLFPYDWRLSNTYNAQLLAEKINEWWWHGMTPQQVDPECKVTIIAHSMGGLLARYFIESEKFDGPRYVRQLITVGTPHCGLPEAYTNLLGKTRLFEMKGIARNVIDFIVWLFDVDPEHAPTGLFTPGMQLRLVRHYASLIEMTPTYDFVWLHKKKEPIDKAWRILATLIHTPTRKSFDKLRREFRDGLISPERLDYWLGCHQIHYHFLAAEGLNTMVGYNRWEGSGKFSAQGDGTVPLESATMALDEPGTRNIHIRRIRKENLVRKIIVERDILSNLEFKIENYGHQDLFKVIKVQSYCREQISKKPASTAGQFELVKAAQPTPVAELLDLAKKIFAKVAKTKKRIVYSVIVIWLQDADNEPTIKLKTERKNGSLRVEGINGLAKNGEVEEVEDKNHRKRSYVFIESIEQIIGQLTVGGVLFLPQDCQPYIELVTWNVGKQFEEGNCQNRSHAEKQFIEWFEKQKRSSLKEPDAWVQRVVKIEINNRDASPCCHCCVDLSKFKKKHSSDIKMSISWIKPYVEEKDQGVPCGYTTTLASLELLKKEGWTLERPCPKPAYAGDPRDPCGGLE